MFVRLFVVTLLSAALVGCPSGSEAPSTEPSKPSDSSGGSDSRTEIQTPPAPEGTLETAEAKPVESFSNGEKRESTAGRWLMSVMKPQFSLPGMTIDLAPGKPPEIVATSQVMETWKVLESDVKETSLEITFSNVNGDPVVVSAELDNSEALRGNAVYGIDGLDFVEFVPVDDVDLSEAKRTPHPAAREFAAMLQANRDMNPAGAREFAAKLPATPIKIAIYQQLVQNGVLAGGFNDEVMQDCEALVESAAPWGKPFQAQQAMLVIASLTTLPDAPMDTLRTWCEKTKALAGDNPTEQLSTALKIGEAAVAARDESVPVEEAQETIDELVAALPHQAVTYQIRSAFAERRGDKNESLRIQSELIALPMPGGDPEQFEELYKSINGSADGIPEYLNTVYDEVLTSFASEPVDGVGDTPVFVELFTGGSCPPCVAADVAIEAIEKTFPENVHVVRYHMDVPAPDPFATAAGQQRFSDAYRLPGTPSIVVNGVPQQVPGTIGPYPFAKVGYANLSSLIKLLSNEEPAAKVSAAAVQKGDIVRVIARAEELPDGSNPSIVIALVSDSLKMLMPNGIREHGMVVRAFPAGPVGTPRPKPENDDEEPADDAKSEAEDADPDKPKDEVAGFEIVTETSLSELSEVLVKGLAVSKEVVEANRETITNLDDLYAVAFVQDGTTGRVLGSTKTKVKLVEADDTTAEETKSPEKAATEAAPKAKAAEGSDDPASNDSASNDEKSNKSAPANAESTDKQTTDDQPTTDAKAAAPAE